MRVLLVSVAFPPKRDPESLQVAKYCKYLNKEEGVHLEVVTSEDPTLFMETDPSLRSYRDGIKVSAEIKIFESRYLNFLIRKLNPNLLLYPDSKFTFWWQYDKVVKSVQKPDLLYSRSYPVSSTLLALELKRKWDIPWVLHLSDPWAIASASDLSPATHLTGKARSWNKKREIECFDLADRICLTSHKTIELYSHRYPALREKFIYVPNVYDDELILNNPYVKGEKLRFIYTGGFGEARSPLTLLDAIQLFWSRYADKIVDHVEFLFTGEMTRANSDIFKRYQAIPIIKHLGIIPYSEVITLQRSADILINIDSDIKDYLHAVFFPSKLLDYLIAQRRILAITNRHSTTQEIVQDKLGDCFEFNETEKLSEYFVEVYTRYLSNDISFFVTNEITMEFSAQANAARLSKLFKYIVNEAKHKR